MDLTELNYFDNQERHPWELARLKVIVDKLRTLINFKSKSNGINQSLRILDVGCGDTFLVSNLAKIFPQHKFIGIDINFTDDQLQFFQTKYQGTNLSISRSLEDLKVDGTADIVLILDVIEHIEDDHGFLQKMRENPLLTIETRLLITVPAFPNLFSNHDVILGHYRRYTNESLERMLSGAGYQLDWINYFFFSLLPIRQIQVWMEGAGMGTSERPSSLVQWRGGRITTQFVTKLLEIDYRVTLFFRNLGLKLPGLSNIVLCHPSPS